MVAAAVAPFGPPNALPAGVLANIAGGQSLQPLAGDVDFIPGHLGCHLTGLDISGLFAVTPETEVTLNAGILTITDINGGTSDDDLTISFAGGTYTITDNGSLPITTPIAGATGDGTATVTIPVAGVTGINVEVLDGNDLVTVNSVQPSLAGGFTITGGDGMDSVAIDGTVTTTGGGITLTAETLSTSQPLATNGGGLTLTTDDLTLGAALSGTGALTIQPQTPAATIGNWRRARHPEFRRCGAGLPERWIQRHHDRRYHQWDRHGPD